MKCIECKREVTEDDGFSYGGDGLHQACVERYTKRKVDQERLSGMVKALIEEVNGGRPEDLADAIVDALTHSHRTLQQSFLGAVKLALDKYSKLDKDTYTDLRNECAYQWTREVAKIDNSDIRFPLI